MKYLSITSALFKSAAIIAVMAGSLSAQPDSYEPIWHCTGENPDEKFGWNFKCIEDQNNNGCDDILVVSLMHGKASLYYGGEDMDTIPDLIFENQEYDYLATRLSYLGRLNDDNNNSFAISRNHPETTSDPLYIYYGGEDIDTIPEFTLYGEQEAYYYGNSIIGCDVNGDNYDDMVVTDGLFDTGSYLGKLYLYYGGMEFDTIPDLTWGNVNDNLGPGSIFARSSGDVNGDGYSDFLIEGGGSMASVFFGGALVDTLADWSYLPMLGFASSYIVPDLNGDEYDDIVVCMNDVNPEYTITEIFYGVETVDTEPDEYFYGYYMTTNMAYAGDVNCDGYGDLIATEYALSDVTVYLGGPVYNWSPAISYNAYSYWVGYIGDVNGDGVDDFAFNDNTNMPDYRGELFICSDTCLAGILNPESRSLIPEFTLHPAYPNPFNAATTIPFTLDRAGKVTLNIYDITGRSVGVQYIEPFQAGTHEFVWDAGGMASGVYLVRLTVDGQASTAESRHTMMLLHSERKVLLLK